MVQDKRKHRRKPLDSDITVQVRYIDQEVPAAKRRAAVDAYADMLIEMYRSEKSKKSP
jgi:hypothetical protein